MFWGTYSAFARGCRFRARRPCRLGRRPWIRHPDTPRSGRLGACIGGASEGDCISVRQSIPIYVESAARRAKSFPSAWTSPATSATFNCLNLLHCRHSRVRGGTRRSRRCRGAGPRCRAAVPGRGAGPVISCGLSNGVRVIELGTGPGCIGAWNRSGSCDGISETVASAGFGRIRRREFRDIPALSSRRIASPCPVRELYLNCSRKRGRKFGKAACPVNSGAGQRLGTGWLPCGVWTGK